MSSELMKKRNEVYGAMKAIMDVAPEKRSESDYAKYEALETEFKNINTQIECEVRFQTIGKNMNEVFEKRAISATSNTDVNIRSAFNGYLRTGDIAELRSVNGYSAAEGAALLPTVLAATISENLQKLVTVRQLPGIEIRTTTTTSDIPLMDTDVSAAWSAEAPSGSFGDTSPAFGKATLRAFKLTALTKVSTEELNDTPTNLESALVNSFTRAFAESEESAFLTGDGSNKPTGILNTSGIAATTVTGSISGSALVDALIDVERSIAPQYRANAVWVLSDAVVGALRKAKTTYGEYIWQPAISADQPATFGGRKVYTSGVLPLTMAAGVHGAIIDPASLVVGDRQGLYVQRLVERYAELGLVGFIASKRVDIAVKRVAGVGKLVLN